MQEVATIPLRGWITSAVAAPVLAALDAAEADPAVTQVYLEIDSPGGLVEPGMAIHDRIRAMRTPVATVAVGEAMSMAAVILAAGTGTRAAAPGARIMIHRPMPIATSMDLMILAREADRYTALMEEALLRYAAGAGTGLDILRQLMWEERIMTAQEAKAVGLVDEVTLDLRCRWQRP